MMPEICKGHQIRLITVCKALGQPLLKLRLRYEPGIRQYGPDNLFYPRLTRAHEMEYTFLCPFQRQNRIRTVVHRSQVCQMVRHRIRDHAKG